MPNVYKPNDHLKDVDWRHSAKWSQTIFGDRFNPQGGSTKIPIEKIVGLNLVIRSREWVVGYEVWKHRVILIGEGQDKGSLWIENQTVDSWDSHQWADPRRFTIEGKNAVIRFEKNWDLFVDGEVVQPETSKQNPRLTNAMNSLVEIQARLACARFWRHGLDPSFAHGPMGITIDLNAGPIKKIEDAYTGGDIFNTNEARHWYIWEVPDPRVNELISEVVEIE